MNKTTDSASPHTALKLGFRSSSQNSDQCDRIENALRIMANIIAENGEEYLPIFEKLEKELAKHQSQKDALARALALSKQNSPP